MLLKFLEKVLIEWHDEGDPSWYMPGDYTVATIKKQNAKDVWLILHSDDDLLCIVPADSFEVVDGVKLWDKEPPQKCELCEDTIEDHFFKQLYRVLCERCFHLHRHDLPSFEPFLDFSGERYEYDKSDNRWIRTG